MKEYAVNIRYVYSDNEWDQADNADWFETYEEAFGAAEEAFSDTEVAETKLSVFEDGEVEGSPLNMIREDDDICQYQDGERLWL